MQRDSSDRGFPRFAAVTGAGGMIGRHVIDLLGRRGCGIRALVRNGAELGGRSETVVGDLASEGALRRLLQGADTVFHCAAELRDPERMHEVNVEGTDRLARLALDEGVSVFCHLSSAGVAGPLRERWIDESTSCRPDGPYECSKWEAEARLQTLAGGKMRICLLRPTNVVDDDRPGIVCGMLRNGWRDRLSLFVKGGEGAHLVHAEDVAAAALYLAEHEGCSGAYFVGCDEDSRNSVAGVAAMVCQALGRGDRVCLSLPAGVPFWLRHIARGKSLHGRSRFSSARLQSSGFEPPLGLDGTVRRICERYKGTVS